MTSQPLHRRRRTDTQTPCDDTTCSAPATRITHGTGDQHPLEWRSCLEHVPFLATLDGAG